MNVRNCSLNNPDDDTVDSENIEEQIYAFFSHSQMSKK